MGRIRQTGDSSVTWQPSLEALTNPWKMPHWFTTLGYYKHRQIGNLVKAQLDRIHRAQLDGIENVAPVLVALRCDPAEAKRRVGKSVWRRVHHSPMHRNVTRARIMMKTMIRLPDLVEFPDGALAEVERKAKIYSEAAVILAGRIARNRTEFREAVMLAHDLARMKGTGDPRWSLRRLREEHDRRAMEWAREKADPAPWREPFTTTQDGYTFTMLNSGADFSAEGSVMRHCVASYREDAKQGRYIIMRIEGPERATVRFGGHPVRVQEVKGRFNAAVSEACRRACAKVCAEHIESVRKERSR
jgi:hypothetical protein